MSAVIEGVGLVKRFGQGDAQVTAVNGVDIAVQSGELAMLKGDSGCGKTTLMSVLGCILKPSEGKTLLEGAEVDYSDERVLPRLRREKIGFVFQMFNLAPYLSALENVLLALDVAGKKGAEAEGRAEELLRQVGLEHRLTHRPGQLSGGEKQRVSFARALANNPKVIFADEPTANLDSRQSANLLALIAELREQFGAAVVIATHQTALEQSADRVIEMRDGRIVG